MKKLLILAICLMFMATGLFAVDIGGGLTFGAGSIKYSYTVEGYYSYWDGYSYSRGYESTDYHDELSLTSLGLFGFLGWKYVDINVGIDLKEFRYGVLMKFPITVSDSFRFYPNIGIDNTFSFQSGIGYNDGYSGYIESDFIPVDFVLRVGAGADILMFRNVFLRGQVLYGLGLFGLFFDYSYNSVLFKLGLGWMW